MMDLDKDDRGGGCQGQGPPLPSPSPRPLPVGSYFWSFAVHLNLILRVVLSNLAIESTGLISEFGRIEPKPIYPGPTQITQNPPFPELRISLTHLPLQSIIRLVRFRSVHFGYSSDFVWDLSKGANWVTRRNPIGFCENGGREGVESGERIIPKPLRSLPKSFYPREYPGWIG